MDYRARVWLNGRYLGEHAGGYTPFRFELDGALGEENLLVVRVEDARDPSLPRGKQTLLKRSFFVFFPTVTGIWQPVWLERVGEVYLAGYRVFPDLESGRVSVACRLAGGGVRARVAAAAVSPYGGEVAGETETDLGEGATEAEMILDCGGLLPRLPSEPNLYGLGITVDCGPSRDEVEACFGARRVEARDGKVWLNGERLYQKPLLCQGYFPGGHYTPPRPRRVREGRHAGQVLGVHGLRMRQKVEDPRFLFWCDVLACLVREEMPSACRFSPRMRGALEREWREVAERDFNHSSIIVRVPISEGWGWVSSPSR